MTRAMWEERKDAVYHRLVAEGLNPERRGALGRADSPILEGYAFVRDGYEMVYRVEQEKTLIIVSYRRKDDGRNLANPFACMLWLFDLVTKNDLGVRYVAGKVDTLIEPIERGLSRERLTRFYTRHLGAKIVEVTQDGVTEKWIIGETATYRSPRARYKAKKARERARPGPP